MFTSKDVARVAGVSQSTVSYVMSGKRPISEKTRKRVLAAIEELTYQPNAGARALASQRTQVIGLVVPFGGPGTDSAGLLPFIETIAASARARDHDVLLVTTDEGSAGLTRLAGRALCDAIVMMDIRTHDERVPVAASLRVPVILIGVPADPMGLTCVDVEFEHMARLAVDELVATGHDRLVLLGYTAEVVAKDVNYVRRLTDAALAAAAGHGRALDVVSPIEWGLDGARVAVKAALVGGGERVGLLVADAHSISSVMAALVEQGLLPGRDVSVIGVATDDAARAMTPALTNVSLEPRDVSRRAMDLLFRLVEPAGDRSAAERPSALVELVRPRLTRRQTVMPAPVPVPRPAAGSASGPAVRRRTTH